MRRYIFSVSISDEETKKTIKRAYDTYGVLLEPHGAVGWRGLQSYCEQFEDFPLCVSLETAHPAKFPDEIKALLNITPDLPQSMKDIDQRRGAPFELSGSYKEFRIYLRNHLKVRSQ
jgi:threonine synthase